MTSPRPHRRIAALVVVCSLLLLAGAIAIAAGPGVAQGASSTTVVSVTVPTATNVDTHLCATGSSATEFGVVLPSTSAVTSADCLVEFGSSNDTSSLRAVQADGAGTAMYTAGTGVLDPSFGGGSVITDYPTASDNDEFNGVMAQTDGKVVSVGTRDPNSGYRQMIVTRHDLSGTLDPAFDGSAAMPCYPCDGRLIVDPGGAFNQDELVDVLQDAAGRIVAVGITSSEVAVVRLLQDGALDPSFGTGGIASFDMGYYDVGTRVVATADGGLLVTGDSSNGGYSSIVLLRLTSSGALDTAYDGDASMTCYPCNGSIRWRFVSSPTAQNRVADVALQANGAAVLATEFSGYSGGVVTRLTSTGALDTTFDGDGMLVPNWPNFQYGSIAAVEVDATGRIYAFGELNDNGGQLVVIRTSSTGVPDPGFGTGGIREWNLSPGLEHPVQVAASPDGSFYVLVRQPTGVDLDVQVARMLADGSPDTRFGTGGYVRTDVGQDDIGRDIAVGADGSVLVGGNTRTSSGADLNGLDLRYAGRSVPDFVDTTADWNDGTSAFGACLRAATQGASTGVGTWTTSGSCTASDSDPWRSVTSAGSTVARTTVTGDVDALVALRFGFRTSLTQPPGRYVSPITFEVVAP